MKYFLFSLIFNRKPYHLVRLSLIVVFIILLTVSAFPQMNLTNETTIANKPYFRMDIDVNTQPYFYEPMNQLTCIAFNGSFMGGVKLKDFTFGLKATENYYSLGRTELAESLIGAFSITRFAFITSYNIKNRVELKWGLGGAINKSAFNYKNSQVISELEGGLSTNFDLSIFLPIRYVDFDVINRLDLFFSDTGVTPYYFGAVRVNFHPYLDWIKIYTEIGGTPWVYQDSSVNVTTGMFVWSVGVQFDKTFKPAQRSINASGTATTMLDKPETSMLSSLRNAKNEDIISLNDISFIDYSTQLTNESYELLNKIVEILKVRQDINLAIGGYSNYLGDPINELELAINRADVIRNYLSLNGVEKNRIKLLARGNIHYTSRDILTNDEQKIVMVVKTNGF